VLSFNIEEYFEFYGFEEFNKFELLSCLLLRPTGLQVFINYL